MDGDTLRSGAGEDDDRSSGNSYSNVTAPPALLALLGPDPAETNRAKTMSKSSSSGLRRSVMGVGRVRKLAGRYGGSMTIHPAVNAGSKAVARAGNKIRAAMNSPNSDSQRYGLSDPFGDDDDNDNDDNELQLRHRGSGRVIVRSSSGTNLYAEATKQVTPKAKRGGGGNFAFDSNANEAERTTTTATPTDSPVGLMKSPSLPEIVAKDGDDGDGVGSASSSVTFSCAAAVDADEEELISTPAARRSRKESKGTKSSSKSRKSRGGSRSRSRSLRSQSVAEVKLAEFLKAENEAIRQMQQHDDDEHYDDDVSVSSTASRLSISSTDSKRLVEEARRAVQEAEDTAQRMKDMMEWTRLQQAEHQQEHQQHQAEGEETREADDPIPRDEVLDDQMVSLEELERRKSFRTPRKSPSKKSRGRSRTRSAAAKTRTNSIVEEDSPPVTPTTTRTTEKTIVVVESREAVAGGDSRRSSSAETESSRGFIQSEQVMAPSPAVAVAVAPSSSSSSQAAANDDDFRPETPSRSRSGLGSAVSGAPSPARPSVTSSVAEYRRKRSAARRKKLVRSAKAAAAMGVAAAACLFAVRRGRILLSATKPQLEYSTPASSTSSAIPPPSYSMGNGAALVLRSEIEPKRHVMGKAYSNAVPPHDAALTNRANWGKVPFLGMSIGDGY
uniref:Uncharacterized protein n=1 Tax=Odontella aurita TaxID=265563 RepID=A0A7S4J448_9STRA|mmetsp:Transcript_38077/g.113737  ORF Transcript_38077/g.113737 Transcript_38077/m.113737 type:complete len:671 (+) Transcript_38077:388-2400(+)